MPVKKPNISVVMNCYNSDTYLAEAVQSVLDQTFKDWEIIFWDNQSTDDSAKIIKSFKDNRIHYFYAPKHTNLSEARNLAIKKTKAKWIAFLDCDDVWLPEKLDEQYKIIKDEEMKKTNLGLVYCKTTVFGKNKKESEPKWSKQGTVMPEGDIFYTYLLTTNFIPLLSAVIKKDVFIKTGGIPLQYRQGEDYFLFAAVSQISSVRVVNKILCRYRVHEGNITHKQKMLAVTETLDILNHWKSKFQKNPDLFKKWKKKIKSIEAMRFVYLILLNRDFSQALKLLFREHLYREVLKFVLLRKDY